MSINNLNKRLAKMEAARRPMNADDFILVGVRKFSAELNDKYIFIGPRGRSSDRDWQFEFKGQPPVNEAEAWSRFRATLNANHSKQTEPMESDYVS